MIFFSETESYSIAQANLKLIVLASSIAWGYRYKPSFLAGKIIFNGMKKILWHKFKKQNMNLYARKYWKLHYLGELQILNNNCYINEEKIWIKVFWWNTSLSPEILNVPVSKWIVSSASPPTFPLSFFKILVFYLYQIVQENGSIGRHNTGSLPIQKIWGVAHSSVPIGSSQLSAKTQHFPNWKALTFVFHS